MGQFNRGTAVGNAGQPILFEAVQEKQRERELDELEERRLREGYSAKEGLGMVLKLTPAIS